MLLQSGRKGRKYNKYGQSLSSTFHFRIFIISQIHNKNISTDDTFENYHMMMMIIILSYDGPHHTEYSFYPIAFLHACGALPSACSVPLEKSPNSPFCLPMAPFFLLLSLSKFFIVMLPLCELQKPPSSSENSLRKMPPDG